MSALDRDVLAEKTQAVVRHLARVAQRLPADATELTPASDASDAVILHLWQATQMVIDLAVAACVQEKLGTPATYGDAFRRLQGAGIIDEPMATRLVRAAGFRNTVAHAYEALSAAAFLGERFRPISGAGLTMVTPAPREFVVTRATLMIVSASGTGSPRARRSASNRPSTSQRWRSASPRESAAA